MHPFYSYPIVAPPMATYATAYPAPYQQPHHPRNYVPRPPPPNWVPPPFNGPPPIPTGITVNPQQWQAGFWKPNPAWNGARPTAQQQQPQPQHALWLPSQHWMQQQQRQQQPTARPQQPQQQQQQQQQPANFNPYKRVIHPPSAEYLATQLSDNPLGLTDMTPVTTEEYYKQGQPVEEQHTPWIWNPAHLEDEDDDSASPSRRNSEPESFTSHLELKPTFSPSIVRTPQHYRDSPSPTVRHKPRSSIDSALSAQMTNLSTKPSLSRNSTMPSLSSPTSSDPDPKPIPTMFLSSQLSDEPDSILSPLIIANTPKPLPPVSLHRNNGVRNNHPNPILATQSLDTIAEAPSSYFHVASNDSSTHATPKARPRDVGHHLPTSPNHTGYQQTHTPSLPRSQTDWQEVKKQREREAEYREREQERAEREQRRQQRDLQEREQRERERVERERRELRTGIGSRHTVTAYVDPYINTSTKHSPGHASRPSPTSGSAHPSPTHYTPPRQVQAQTTPPSGLSTHVTSPTTTTTPRTNNPLPPPPEPSNHIPLTTTPASPSTSTATSTSKTTTSSTTEPYHPPPQGPTPPSYNYKTRHGYWNRRGDHLTPTGYLVYAPPHLANPSDLRIYPPENEGYMDHNGLYTAWCQRPELPASLPRMGKEPELPYEKFVVWVYK